MKETAQVHFGLGEDASVFIAEITCGKSDGSDIETGIAFLLAGRMQEFRIEKPIVAITAQDLASL